MLRDEVVLFNKLSGRDGEHTPISVIGAYLDGYEKGKEESIFEGGWINAENVIPMYPGVYLVCIDKLITICQFNGKSFLAENGERIEVSAWQYLPKPYKKEEEDEDNR